MFYEHSQPYDFHTLAVEKILENLFDFFLCLSALVFPSFSRLLPPPPIPHPAGKPVLWTGKSRPFCAVKSSFV